MPTAGGTRSTGRRATLRAARAPACGSRCHRALRECWAAHASFGSGIALRTSDRPGLLARLLASAANLEGRGGPKRRWVVFDDSRDPANEQANRATISAWRSLDIVHIGRVESAALECKLSAEFPRAEREIAWL